VSLAVRRGEFVAVVGRSGSGKSTLLKIMAGLLPATGGRVTLDGAQVAGPPRQVRYVFQDYRASLLPWRTVLDNVKIGIRHGYRRAGQDSVKSTAESLLRQVGLAGIGDRHPPQLSGGMQQRVALARAIASNPEVLLLDEAFGSVDALSRAQLQDTLLTVWRAWHLTVVFVTHDIDEAIYLADRVIVLADDGAGIDTDLEIELPRPRDQIASRSDTRFLDARATLLGRVLKTDGGAS
jgi:ABC-type nitrate/sulfonate/bicarbonate transport system ATPase subunit